MQRRMTVARIPPVITTVPAVIRPTPHQTLRRRVRRGQGPLRCHTGRLHSWRQGGLTAAGAGRAPGTGHQGLPEDRVAVAWALDWGTVTAVGRKRGGRVPAEEGILLRVSIQSQRFLLSFSFNYLLPLLSSLLISCSACPLPPTLPLLTPRHKTIVPVHLGITLVRQCAKLSLVIPVNPQINFGGRHSSPLFHTR